MCSEALPILVELVERKELCLATIRQKWEAQDSMSAQFNG
jgi:hypothetical protein